MAIVELSAEEARVIGCLIEKSVTTPDQYPLTLNALTAACNQKSSRDPVMSLDQGTVQRTARALEAKNLLRVDENYRGRAERYLQRFCNTRYSDYQFESDELAVVCLLLLRGAQTAGELRSRSGRLHAFADNDAVVEALARLSNRDEALVVKLERRAGRRDSEYMHLFCGRIEAPPIQSPVQPPTPAAKRPVDGLEDGLEARVARLERELASPEGPAWRRRLRSRRSQADCHSQCTTVFAAGSTSTVYCTPGRRISTQNKILPT